MLILTPITNLIKLLFTIDYRLTICLNNNKLFKEIIMYKIYLDNGATSFPKPIEVVNSISTYISSIGGNINRGAYENSFHAENIVFETRELLCELFNYNEPTNVVFTKNITESLNVILKGLLKTEDHVIVSSMEHNAVMRPLNSLSNSGVSYTAVHCNEEGELDLLSLKNYIKPNTKAVVMTHSSNVCGTILPYKEIGEFCKNNNLYFIADTAQTAGFLDIDMMSMNIDVLCFTGHKSLLGPQGIGGFIIKDSLISKISPLIEGGTGSMSEYEIQPSYMPDKFEGGTLNMPGIYGLNASLKYLKAKDLKSIREEELALTKLFLDNLLPIKNIKILGKPSIINRTPVISIDFLEKDNGEIAYTLSKNYGIATRCGLHCAPSAHKTLGTCPKGTVRFSLGMYNTEAEINYTLKAIKEICVMK